MARKMRKIQDASSDDDAPEVVSHSMSKADAKRNQQALHDFEAEEKARRKARNRERDQKLKERTRVTKGGKTTEKMKGVRFIDQALVEEDGGESGEDRGDDDDDVEARMLRAMRDGAGEAESDEGDDDDDHDGEFMGFGKGMDLGDDMASASDSSFAQAEDDEDASISQGESDAIDSEAPTDDEEMDEDEDTTSLQEPIIHRPGRKADYLADDLFVAAFTSQNSKPAPKKSVEVTQQQTVKKRRRKSIARPKDLLIGYVVPPRFFPGHLLQVQWSYHPHVTPTIRSTITSHSTKCPVCTRSQIRGPKPGYERQASACQGQEKRLGETAR